MMLSRGIRKEAALVTGLVSLFCLSKGYKNTSRNLGFLALLLRFWPVPQRAYADKSVVITGGSRGLGFALAKRYAKEDAHLTLIARDAEELDKACALLRKSYPNVTVNTSVCDVTNPEQVEEAIAHVKQRAGRIDLVINNAGTITVGPVSTLEQNDYESLIKLQVYAVINVIKTAQPLLRGGQVVNISSIGGRLSVPHMSSYCVAKHALSALSEGLRAELAPQNITVTTVYPGLMRTGSPIQAVFKGDHEKEYAWFAAGDALPGLSVSAEAAAQKIYDGVSYGDAVVRFPASTRWGIWLHALLPETYAIIMQVTARYLPNGESKARQTGASSKSWLERQLWYKPLLMIDHQARKTLNQKEKYDADFNLGL